MNISANELNALLQLVNRSPQASKALLKLVSVDILKALDNNTYLVNINNKQLTATSEQSLALKSNVWAEFSTKENQIHITKLLPKPTLLTEPSLKAFQLNEKEFLALMQAKEPLTTHKNQIMEQMAQATSKEEFTALSQQLLALNAHTLQIPLQYHAQFGLLQMKKRYNNTTKKTSIDFYAALHHLGPISGTIMVVMEQIEVHLDVAFKSTQYYLEHDLNFLPKQYHLKIFLTDTITPLFEPTNSAILDLSI